jgi:hypothetical protein
VAAWVAAAVVGFLTADPVQRRRLSSMASLPTRRPRICWTVRQSQIPSFRTLWKMEDHFFLSCWMEHLLAEVQEGQFHFREVNTMIAVQITTRQYGVGQYECMYQ